MRGGAWEGASLFLLKGHGGTKVWLTRFKQQYIPRVRDLYWTPIFVKPTIQLDSVGCVFEVAINSYWCPVNYSRSNGLKGQ